MTTYYKVLDGTGRSVHGGDMQWPLPHDGKPGAWTPKITDLIPCKRGYHVCTLDQLPRWLTTIGLWECEIQGEIINHDDKTVVESARLIRRVNQWNPRTVRLLTALWVEYLLSQGHYDWATQKERDELTRLVDVTRRYADGGSSSEELREARSSSTLLSLSLSLSLSSLLSLSSSSWSSLTSSTSLTLSSLTLSSLSSLSSSSSSSLSSSLTSSERQWLRDRWIELLTAPGDWSHVSWEEW